MNQPPKISIVIPVFNGQFFIEKCLQSIRQQTIKDIEIIVVDNNSTDSSLAILKKIAQEDKRIKILQESKLGCGPARRKGFLNATGEIIATIDIDCLVPCNWLYKITKLLIEGGEQATMGGAYDTTNGFWSKKIAELENRILLSSTSNGYINYLDTKNCAFKKDAITKVNQKNLTPIASDLETFCRLNENGVKIKYCPEASVGHHNPHNLKTFAQKQYHRSFWTEQIYKRYQGQVMSSPQFSGRSFIKIILWPLWLLKEILKQPPADGWLFVVSELSWKAGWFVSLWIKKEW